MKYREKMFVNVLQWLSLGSLIYFFGWKSILIMLFIYSAILSFNMVILEEIVNKMKQEEQNDD